MERRWDYGEFSSSCEMEERCEMKRRWDYGEFSSEEMMEEMG